jgi:hypothetical protein
MICLRICISWSMKSSSSNDDVRKGARPSAGAATVSARKRDRGSAGEEPAHGVAKPSEKASDDGHVCDGESSRRSTVSDRDPNVDRISVSVCRVSCAHARTSCRRRRRESRRR